MTIALLDTLGDVVYLEVQLARAAGVTFILLIGCAAVALWRGRR